MHRKQLATSLNLVIGGQIDCALPVTLLPNAASTTVTDSRIGPTTTASLTPNTAHAAAELAAGTLYIPLNQMANGSLVIIHANNSQADRTFTLNLSG